jgi:serine/threonine-protein kinase
MLERGAEFAGYTIERQLGTGGMGEVYLAQHPRLPRREALKILKADISNDDSFRQRFIREADSIAALEHPHIVTVHDRGATDGRLWIATQFVDGADAAQLLRDRYPAGMPADEVAAITTAVADALDYAHGQGLLHRDVKPANILLSRPDRDGNRRIYLADFGIARPLDDPAGLTATNFTLGTFAYAAPEQLMGKAIDGRADQYALAATAYHLLTGRPLYSDTNPVAVISQHLTEPPPPPSTVRPELAPFDAAFARALAKQPQDRFTRCQDFANALAAATTAAGGYSATAPTQEAPTSTPPLQKARAEDPERRSSETSGEQSTPNRTTPPNPTTAAQRKPRRLALITGAAAIAGISGFAALWGNKAHQEPTSSSPTTPAVESEPATAVVSPPPQRPPRPTTAAAPQTSTTEAVRPTPTVAPPAYSSNPVTAQNIPELEAVPMDGPTADAYRRLGGEPALGAPTSGMETISGGTRMDFASGSLFSSPSTGAHLLMGEILRVYLVDHGGPAGPLGFPIADIATYGGGPKLPGGGWISTFQHGTITWTNDGTGRFKPTTTKN